MRIPYLGLLTALVACNTPTSKDTSGVPDTEPILDVDGDGYVSIGGGGDDCNDEDATVNPGVEELCDGQDNNCDGVIDEGATSTFYADIDGDGFGSADHPMEACEPSDGYVETNTDCDDLINVIYPGAPELCDTLDNDCDGSIDEDIGTAQYLDLDGDGFGDPNTVLVSCEAIDGYVGDNTDCNDADAMINPDANEVCNRADDDCDGETDEGALDASVWYADLDGDFFGGTYSIEACDAPAGYVADTTDCDDGNNIVFPGADELCDSLDNDCDGSVDEDAVDAGVWYADLDGDGFGDGGQVSAGCVQPPNTSANDADCNDADGRISPAATELCDGFDNDCDGLTDESDASDAPLWYFDQDLDGFGDGTTAMAACAAPAGYIADSTDCDDTVGTIYPGAPELCNGYDDDCDGSVDEDGSEDEATWYQDSDQDGYGDAGITLVSCAQPPGYVLSDTDCNDADFAINPAATEVCDAQDNDCDGQIDEPDAIDATPWYADTDTDGFGDPGTATPACTQPAGFVADNTDCNDADTRINPAATEVCDAQDNDCDGLTDESDASDAATWYADTDTDGFGDPAAATPACTQPAGFVSDNTDCNDQNNGINPAATEYCDGLDNDCDGQTDENDAFDSLTWYADTDTDGFGDPASAQTACSQPPGYVADNTDCNDSNTSINPAATEYCDGLDNNCNGHTDEPTAADATTWYADIDTDGYGNPASSLPSCTQPAGYVADNTDCNDAISTINPGADEYCDGLDQNCNTLIDDNAVDASFWYADTDTDGYGDANAGTWSCTQPAGTSSTPTDCNDNNNAIYPGAPEHCDGVDEDCDGAIDDNAVDATTWYYDTDGDGYGDAANPIVSCSQPSGAITDGSDCDDTDDEIYPGAIEICDGVQNDCADATWVNDDGIVTFYNASGVMSDYTATIAGGTVAAPKTVSLATSGDLYICGGTYYNKFNITASDLAIIGVDSPVLSGADKITVLNLLARMTLDVYDLDITQGAGCFGSAIAGGQVYSCSNNGASTGHANVDVSLYGVNIYNNRTIIGGGTITLGYATGFYMEDTMIADNTGDAIWNINTPIDCIGSSTNTGGPWGNRGYGIWLWDVSSSASYGITSDTCDFGTGNSNNSYSDVQMLAGSSSSYNYSDDASFTCNTSNRVCQ